MRGNRMLLLSLIMGATVTGLAVLFEWLLTYIPNFHIPEWLLWLLFFTITITSFYYATYYILIGRIRGIQQGIQKKNLSSDGEQIADVRNLQELEDKLREWSETQSALVEEMKGREQFRREYIGNVSHELKTPIFNIQGYIYTLLDGALKDEKVAKKFLKRAAKSVERMTQLVKDMDVLTKVESGEYDVQLRPVIVRNLIDDALSEIENLANKRKSTIKVHFAVEEDTQVLCDAARLEQVLDNLLVNAIKYSPEDSTVDFFISGTREKIEFRIKDQGFGISEEDLPHVFERFYRVDKARSRDAGGTGLGLSIVKHIIERHGESIKVVSTEGQGTEFTFTLKRI
ncbi:MAG TPA: two-component sensor histidine kinase [Cryomorphaceae bacterium]|mgnify:CR=1 FL=1|nr:two-component sensor histidine kinase [Cryomorphaceae bacterium]